MSATVRAISNAWSGSPAPAARRVDGVHPGDRWRTNHTFRRSGSRSRRGGSPHEQPRSHSSHASHPHAGPGASCCRSGADRCGCRAGVANALRGGGGRVLPGPSARFCQSDRSRDHSRSCGRSRMTREERRALLGDAVIAQIHERVAAAPEASPELIDKLRRIFFGRQPLPVKPGPAASSECRRRATSGSERAPGRHVEGA